MLLRLSGIDTYYGQIHILSGVDMEGAEGELVCLLGGNASGKSTTLKTILGFAEPRKGRAAERNGRVRRRGCDREEHELPDPAGNGDRPRDPAVVRSDVGARE